MAIFDETIDDLIKEYVGSKKAVKQLYKKNVVFRAIKAKRRHYIALNVWTHRRPGGLPPSMLAIGFSKAMASYNVGFKMLLELNLHDGSFDDKMSILEKTVNEYNEKFIASIYRGLYGEKDRDLSDYIKNAREIISKGPDSIQEFISKYGEVLAH